MFGKIIQFVGFSWAPDNEEVSSVFLILDPIESHVHFFGFFGLAVDLMVPKSVELLVCIGVGGYW